MKITLGNENRKSRNSLYFNNLQKSAFFTASKRFSQAILTGKIRHPGPSRAGRKPEQTQRRPVDSKVQRSKASSIVSPCPTSVVGNSHSRKPGSRRFLLQTRTFPSFSNIPKAMYIILFTYDVLKSNFFSLFSNFFNNLHLYIYH